MWNQSLMAEMDKEVNVAVPGASRLLRAVVKCPI